MVELAKISLSKDLYYLNNNLVSLKEYILDTLGEDSCFIGSLDMVSQRLLEYKCLIDSLQIGICVMDREGIVTVWNPAIEKVYNIDREEIIGRPLKDFFENSINLRVLEDKKAIDSRFHKPSTGCEIIINAVPIYNNGDFQGVVSIDYSIGQVQKLSDQLYEAENKIRVLEKELKEYRSENSDFFVGRSEKVREQIELALMTADTDVPILLYGESGTGKEVFARFIHKKSKVKGRFVAVNCSAIPDSLFESEFFGYEEGAFTGAHKSGHQGYFEQADSGTLFLDEISELPLQQQSKLLRVIQEGKVSPLGSEKEVPVNVRIISATNIDLETKVREKKFRIDLYYRLKGIKIIIPPLRERQEDLEDMLKYFLKEMAERYNRKIHAIDKKTLDILKRYDWPGNIREMKNIMRQMVLLNKTDILTPDVIPKDIYFYGSNPEFKKTNIFEDEDLSLTEKVEEFEKYIISKKLIANHGNIAQTSKELKVARSTLHYKIDKYKINI